MEGKRQDAPGNGRPKEKAAFDLPAPLDPLPRRLGVGLDGFGRFDGNQAVSEVGRRLLVQLDKVKRPGNDGGALPEPALVGIFGGCRPGLPRREGRCPTLFRIMPDDRRFVEPRRCRLEIAVMGGQVAVHDDPRNAGRRKVTLLFPLGLIGKEDAGGNPEQGRDVLQIPDAGDFITQRPAAAGIVMVIGAKEASRQDKGQPPIFFQEIRAAVGQEDGGDLQMGKVGRLFGFHVVPFGQVVQNVLVFFVFNGTVGKPGWIAEDEIELSGKKIGLVVVLDDELPDAVPAPFLGRFQPEIDFVETVRLLAAHASDHPTVQDGPEIFLGHLRLMQTPGGEFFAGIQGVVEQVDILEDLRIQDVLFRVDGQGKLIPEEILHAFGGQKGIGEDNVQMDRPFRGDDAFSQG